MLSLSTALLIIQILKKAQLKALSLDISNNWVALYVYICIYIYIYICLSYYILFKFLLFEKDLEVTKNVKKKFLEETGIGYGQNFVCSDNPGPNIWKRVIEWN